jgi:hypothetical protein
MDTKTIKVPALFYRDHDERGCEPFCNPVKRTARYVWLRVDDPGLPELLDDAGYYADQYGPATGEGYRGLRKSAAATVKAIRGIL